MIAAACRPVDRCAVLPPGRHAAISSSSSLQDVCFARRLAALGRATDKWNGAPRRGAIVARSVDRPEVSWPAHAGRGRREAACIRSCCAAAPTSGVPGAASRFLAAHNPRTLVYRRAIAGRHPSPPTRVTLRACARCDRRRLLLGV